MMNRLGNGDFGALKVKAVLTNTQNEKKKVKKYVNNNNFICPICGYDIPVGKEHMKEAFTRCNDCGATCHENMKTSKVSLYFPSED